MLIIYNEFNRLMKIYINLLISKSGEMMNNISMKNIGVLFLNKIKIISRNNNQ